MTRSISRLVGVSFLIGLLLFASTLSSCAWIFGGFRGKSEAERSADIQWGYFILDVLFTGAIGLIIDFATGAIYKSKGGGLMTFSGPMDLCNHAKLMAGRASADGLEPFARDLAAHVERCPQCLQALRGPGQGSQLIIEDYWQVRSLITPIRVCPQH